MFCSFFIFCQLFCTSENTFRTFLAIGSLKAEKIIALKRSVLYIIPHAHDGLTPWIRENTRTLECWNAGTMECLEYHFNTLGQIPKVLSWSKPYNSYSECYDVIHSSTHFLTANTFDWLQAKYHPDHANHTRILISYLESG
jgi:hypothetical protein